GLVGRRGRQGVAMGASAARVDRFLCQENGRNAPVETASAAAAASGSGADGADAHLSGDAQQDTAVRRMEKNPGRGGGWRTPVRGQGEAARYSASVPDGMG